MHYTIAIKTPRGQGDYGSDWRTVVRLYSSKATAMSRARDWEHSGHKVFVFRGHKIGKLVYETTA